MATCALRVRDAGHAVAVHAADHSAAKLAGFELRAIDRPGYATTSRRRGRRIVDVVDDASPCSAPSAGMASRCGVDRVVHRTPSRSQFGFLIESALARASSDLAPYDAPDLNWYAGMSSGNVAELTAVVRGEDAYRPLVERVDDEAMTTIEAGGIQVAANRELPESDRRALDERRAEDGPLERMPSDLTR